MPCCELRRLRRLRRHWVSPVLVLALASFASVGSGQASGPASVPAPVGAETPVDPAGLGVERQIGEPAGSPRAGEQLQSITESVSAKLRCPVCQGMSVADSPSASARAMKTEIEDLLAQGYSETQVKEYFESTYGEFVLLDPKREGLNWIVWLAPGVAFGTGLLWVLWSARKRAETESDGAESDGADLEPYLDRVRSQVAGFGDAPETSDEPLG